MFVLKLWSDLHRRTPIYVTVYEPFDFDIEYAKANWFQIMDHVKVPIVRLETLLRMKEEAGRKKDLLDIASLRQVMSYR